MTPISKRTFIKRSGSATLAAALGLGIMQSTSVRVRATDTSVSTAGVKYFADADPDANTQVRAVAPALWVKHYIQSTSAFSYGQGSMEMTVYQDFSAFPNICTQELTVRIYRISKYTQYANGIPYIGKAIDYQLRGYRCINGAIAVETVAHTNTGISPLWRYGDPATNAYLGSDNAGTALNLDVSGTETGSIAGPNGTSFGVPGMTSRLWTAIIDDVDMTPASFENTQGHAVYCCSLSAS